AMAYQRLSSYGFGPIGVVARDSGGLNGPDLLVTNSDGTVTLLPGIGSAGIGSGFFQGNEPLTFSLHSPIVQSLLNPTTGAFYVVADNGSLSLLTGGIFQMLVSHGVATLGAFDSDLVVGFENGKVGLLSGDGMALAPLLSVFADEPSALEAL